MEDPIYVWRHIAEDQGYFDEEGLTVEVTFVEGSPMAAQMLVSGQADITWVGCAPTLNAYGAGYPMVSFLNVGSKFVFEVVVKEDSPITAWTADQIKGKVIGVSNLAGGEMPMLYGAIKTVGLVPNEDVIFKEIGEGQPLTFQQLEENEVDMYSSALSDVARLESAGMKLRRVNPEGIEVFPFNTMVTLRPYFEENKDVCARFARAVAKSFFWFYNNPEGACNISSKYLPDVIVGYEEDIIYFYNKLFIEVSQPPIGTMWGYHSYSGWDDYQRYLLKAGNVDPDEPITFTEVQDISKIIDDSIVKDALNFNLTKLIAEAKAYKMK
ncbi:ABC transporter substrate-binding protein [Chloroflexota bacterium]